MKITEQNRKRTYFLGVELGSTRIKAALTDERSHTIAIGSHTWENSLVDNIWTYSLDDLWAGVQDAVSQLPDLSNVSGIGVSAMMHGYLAFGRHGGLLTPFRTWRNTFTSSAAAELSGRFSFNIPDRWSVAHLYYAIQNHEAHTADIAYMTTLAGYVHWKLTGRKVLGVGDASGIFPVSRFDYDETMLKIFDELIASENLPWKLWDILPEPLNAGHDAGYLTEEGAKLLSPVGKIKPGIPLCPPEGDAGTGMVATNSIAERTGNVSAGTSVFAMVVLEKPLKKYYREIDIVTTPDGKPVAMVHSNECTSVIDPWIKLFGEAAGLLGANFENDELYGRLYEIALQKEGRLPEFMRGLLSRAVSEMHGGISILTEKEGVKIDCLTGHGGYFKSGSAGRIIMGETLGIPIKLLRSASEGGAWGIAVLAAYREKCIYNKIALNDYLSEIFAEG